MKKSRLNKGKRIKSDERILGDSKFVMQVLDKADEENYQKYKPRTPGYDVARVEKKVIDLFDIDKDELYSGSRKKTISEARSVFCYWCVRELRESMASMAKRLGLTQPAIIYAVDRGEQIATKRRIKLLQ